MSLLDSSIVNVALPGIIHDFHSTVARGQFVVTVTCSPLPWSSPSPASSASVSA